MPLARARGQQQGLQQLEEQKMPEMVRAYLQLEAIGSPALRRGNDASIRNKDIYPITSPQKVRCCSTHAGQVTQVHEKKLDPATAFTGAENVLDDCLAFRFVADSKKQCGIGGMEGASSLDTNAGGATGDYNCLVMERALEFLVGDDLECTWSCIAGARWIRMGSGIRA